jgi:N-acetylmuramoyl-L-alanine amidase
MRLINKLIIHCSDSNHPEHGLEVIDDWHRDRGFSEIGYHYLITKEHVEIGRDIHKIPASCKGHNAGSIAICLAGKDNFTPFQFKSLKTLVRILQGIYKIPDEAIYNHYDLNADKSCPNFDVHVIMDKW